MSWHTHTHTHKYIHKPENAYVKKKGTQDIEMETRMQKE